MKKLIFMVLLLSTALYGNIATSPNGHTYEHVYSYYSDFSIANHNNFIISRNTNYYGNYKTNHYVTRSSLSGMVIQFDLSGASPGVYILILDVMNSNGDYVEVYNGSIGYEGSSINIACPTSLGLTYGSSFLSFRIKTISNNIVMKGADVEFVIKPLDTVYQNTYGDEIYIFNKTNDAVHVKRPILFVEGFDPLNTSHYDFYKYFYDQMNYNNSVSSFDVYHLNLKNAARDMRDNAMSTLGAIQFIGQMYQDIPGFLSEGTRVFGFSMGGVISRYALAFAEDNQIQHHCSQFISCDSPQRGASLNENFQNVLVDAEADADDWNLALDFLGFSIEDDIHMAISSLNNTSAKQLLRKNVFVTPQHSYDTGSSSFLDFYSEINPEERQLFNPTGEVLNNDPNDPLNKPGFPYKQNNIKCLAITNSNYNCNGNVSNHNNLLEWDILSYHYTANAVPYDNQPGSTYGIFGMLDDFPHMGLAWFHHVLVDIDLPTYDPIFIPLRSSLCLKPYSLINPNSYDFSLDISSYGNIVAPQNYSISQYLREHTYFNDFITPTESHEHTYSNDYTLYNSAINWISDSQNSCVDYIVGKLNVQCPQAFTVKLYTGSTFISQTTPGSDGIYRIPYPYHSDLSCEIRVEGEGYYTYSQSINITYMPINGLLVYDLSPVSIYPIGTNVIKVSHGSTLDSGFYSLNHAVNYALAHSISRIFVFPGTYDESLYIYVPDSGFNTLEIIGTNNQVYLTGYGSNTGRIITVVSTVNFNNFILKNLIIGPSQPDNLHRRGGIEICGHVNNFVIENSTIRNIGYTYDYMYSTVNGIAILTGVPTTIRNCIIFNNHGAYCYGSPGYESQGVIWLGNNSTSPSIIENCQIYNNSASDAGAIYITGTGQIQIKDNQFYNNKSRYKSSQYPYDESDSHVIRCENATNTIIERNQFYDNGIIPNFYAIQPESNPGFCIRVDNCGTSQSYCSINNNIFTRVNSEASSLTGAIRIGGNSYTAINNNIIMKHGKGLWNNSTAISTNNIVKNSLFWDNVSNFWGNLPANLYDMNSNPGNCVFSDPQLDLQYYPIWNSSIKSPCIDNGNPDTDRDNQLWYTDSNDRDYDGTQLDIGAFPLTDGHLQDIHRLTRDEIKWISFPGIYNPENPEHIPSEESSILNVFDTFHENNLFQITPPIILDDIWCKTNQTDYTAEPGEIPLHYVSSQNGYKVRLRNDYMGEKVIEYQGYRPGNQLNAGMWVDELGDYTPELYIKHPGNPENPEEGTNCYWDSCSQHWLREIYLGYYMPSSLKPRDALAPIWDDIIGVFAEDWCTVRLPQVGNNGYTENWLDVPYEESAEVAINSGDMVMVMYEGDDDVEFKWGGTNPNPPYVSAYYREMATHFEYQEQPEYVPIFLTLNLNSYENGDKPVEIAVFVREECKGAAIIKEDQVQLNAYILNDPTIELKDLQFQMYFPVKGVDAEFSKYSVMNYSTGSYESRKVKVADCGRFLQVKLDAPSDVPTVTTLIGNYPNPFNPETQIKFDIAKSGNVKLEVFNVKGQVVKTLVKGQIEAGKRAIKWNGLDEQSKPVSSGVYFYRLTTDGKCWTNKMLMLK